MLKPEKSETELRTRLKEISDIDQSDDARSKAPECLEQLRGIERDYLGTCVAPDYYNLLSIVCFHVGQIEASRTGEVKDARVHFQTALDYAQSALMNWQRLGVPIDYQWLPYVEATIAYCDGQINRVAELKEKCFSGNMPIVESFINGLKKWGTPNYVRDYFQRVI